MTNDQTPAGDDGRDEYPDDRFVVTVVVTSEQAADLIGRGELDLGDHPTFAPIDEDRARLTVFASRSQIGALQSEGFDVEVGDNMSALGRARASEVGQGDRFDGGRVAPRGIGRKIGGRGPDVGQVPS